MFSFYSECSAKLAFKLLCGFREWNKRQRGTYHDDNSSGDHEGIWSRIFIILSIPFSPNALSLLENHKIPMLIYIIIELGLNLWPRSEHNKSYFLQFKRCKRPFCFWMSQYCYVMSINNDSITGHVIHKSQYETRINEVNYNFIFTNCYRKYVLPWLTEIVVRNDIYDVLYDFCLISL